MSEKKFESIDKTMMGLQAPTPKEREEAQAAEQTLVSPGQKAKVAAPVENRVLEVKKDAAGVYQIEGANPVPATSRGSEYTEKGTFQMKAKVVVTEPAKAPAKKRAAPGPNVTDKGTIRIEPVGPSPWAEKGMIEKKTTVQVAAANGLLPSSMMPKYEEPAPDAEPANPPSVREMTRKKAIMIAGSVASIVAITGIATAVGLSNGKKSSESTPRQAISASASPEPVSTSTSIPATEDSSTASGEPSGSQAEAVDSATVVPPIPTLNPDAGTVPAEKKKVVPTSRQNPALPAKPSAAPKNKEHDGVINPWQ